MKGRLGHRFCHQCLMPPCPRISPHVDLTEGMLRVGSLSHARSLLPAWIQKPFWQLSYAREKEDKVSFPYCGFTKNSSYIFKSAMMLKAHRHWQSRPGPAVGMVRYIVIYRFEGSLSPH